MDIMLGGKDATLIDIGFKSLFLHLSKWWMSSVSKPKFPCLIDHNFSTSTTVSHANIQVPVLTYVSYYFLNIEVGIDGQTERFVLL